MALPIGAAAIAGSTAAAAYIDAKYHLSQDAIDIWRQKKAEKIWAKAAKQDRLSLFYFFENQVKAMPASQECIWSRMGTYTWQETHAMACRYAQFLLSHGVRPGDLISTYLTNCPEFMFAYIASWSIGSAPALINFNLSGDALVHCLKISGAKVLLADADSECAARIEEARGRIEGELGMKIIMLDEATKRSIAASEPKRPEDKYRNGMKGSFPMLLMYTSGTTGMPKACPFPIARAWHVGNYRKESNRLRSGPGGDRWYDTMPLYHGTGNTVAVSCLLTGQTLCIGKKFSVSRFWQDIRDSRATCFVYVGETARYLLNAPPSPLDRDHCVRMMYGNGLRPDVWKKFQNRFGIETVSEFFNSTEGVFSLANYNRSDFTTGSVGHMGAVKRFQTRNTYIPVALDHEKGDIYRDPVTGFGKRTSYEEGGELIVAIPTESVFGGYWNNPEATEKKFLRNVFKKGDLYYRTGDALRRTSDGRWYFMDRLGDTFRWKSENVSTAEVAECLGRFPGIHEANVYGVELPAHDGKAGCAALYIPQSDRAKFDFRALLAHCRSSLPRYAVPVFLRLTSESQMGGHNNKQNKVPFRMEGVNPESIRTGSAGPGDEILWAEPKGETYVPFGKKEWEALGAGRARL